MAEIYAAPSGFALKSIIVLYSHFIRHGGFLNLPNNCGRWPTKIS